MRTVVLVCLLAGCGRGDLYRACEGPDDCEVPEDADPVCLDKGDDEGFCTWSCAVDADCDGADDEDWDFVCAPFESSGEMSCFPSCEDADEDEDEACPKDMTCRSTGGGSENRKICFPEA